MTQEQCESAVKALQNAGHYASHVMGAPDDHGVWIEVWNNDLGACHEFRIHDEEIEWWRTQNESEHDEFDPDKIVTA